jgi:hypothetical protein
MSITISGGGVAGITVETDPTALKLTGGTLSGKLFTSPTSGVAGFNIGTGGTDAGSTTAGDMWIATGGATLNFRDGLGAWRQCLNTNTAGIIQTTSTAPALRVTQMGNGEAFRVEDSTTPDTTAFVISNNGKVGIGVAPDSSACLRVDNTGINRKRISNLLRIQSGSLTTSATAHFLEVTTVCPIVRLLTILIQLQKR